MSEIKQNTIGKEFTLFELIKFVIGPVLSQLLVSLLQTLDDSVFLSRYCGENSLAAFSIALPWFMLMDAFGMMFAAAGNLCSIKMGEKKNEEAKSDFTTMSIFVVVVGIVLSLVLVFFLEPILLLLGETENLMPYAKTYMEISRFYLPLILLSYINTRFFFVAGKPKYSVISSMMSACINLFFDYIFIAKLGMGIKGAAYTNLISNSVVTIFAFIFFINKKHEIHYVKPNSKLWDLVKKVISLGKAPFITSLSVSINMYISNLVQLNVAGELFVAAFSIVNGVTFLFMHVFFSLVGTTMPMVGYAYGEKNKAKLAKILRQILIIVTGTIFIIILIFVFGRTFIEGLYLTSESDMTLRSMVDYGLKVTPLAFLVFGYNVLVQECANALANPKISTTLAIIENVLFSNLFMLLLPNLFGPTIIWYVFPIAELATFFFSVYVVFKNREVYGY